MYGRTLLTAALLGMVCCLFRPGLAAQTAIKPAAHHDNHKVLVTLRPAAVVDEPIVTVSDVALVQGGDLWLRQQIAGLDVAEVSQVGRTVAVSREQVSYRIRIAGIE